VAEKKTGRKGRQHPQRPTRKGNGACGEEKQKAQEKKLNGEKVRGGKRGVGGPKKHLSPNLFDKPLPGKGKARSVALRPPRKCNSSTLAA